VEVGEVYIVQPECALPTGKYEKRPMKGKVIWIHPLARFAVLEFEGVTANPRECFWPDELNDKNRVQSKRWSNDRERE